MSTPSWTLDGDKGTVGSTLFGTSVEIDNWEGAPENYVAACVALFESLPEATLDHLCEASIRYHDDFLEAIGEPPRAFASPRDVLALIRPSLLIVPSPENRRDSGGLAEPVVHIEGNCEWEPEHGIEWLVRGERVLYVGPFEGADPWGDGERSSYV